MRAKKLNGKWVIFSEPQWKSTVSRFDWEERKHDESGGSIPSGGCVLCLCHSDRKGDCGDCPLAQFVIVVTGCFDSPGCYVAINILLEIAELGARVFSASDAKVHWNSFDDAIAKKQIQYIHAWLLSMDSVTPSQVKKLRR